MTFWNLGAEGLQLWCFFGERSERDTIRGVQIWDLWYVYTVYMDVHKAKY